jgi:cytochrome bd-type quinol oxidase subunit 2
MVNLLETLYIVAAISALITGLAWIQSRAPGDRSVRYRRRFRRFGWLTLGTAAAAAILYWYLSPPR